MTQLCLAAHFLAVSFAAFSALTSTAAALEYSINEELPVNSEFGNAKLAHFDLRGVDSNGRRFSLFQATSGHRGLFEVDPISGALRVSQRVDREELCGREPLCRVEFKVLLQNPHDEVSILVNILDINDCTPAWQVNKADPMIRVTFREDDLPGRFVAIPAAHDPDLGRNGSVNYRLSNLGAPFTLRLNREEGQLFLETSNQLDREERSTYNMTLLAIDEGSPPLTGSIQVLVEVTDVNDNAPQFSRSLFAPNRPIFENEAVNSLILVLNATDRDSGSYGRVVFDFAPDLSVGGAERLEQQRVARRHFQVTQDGRVLLQRKLDYDTMSEKSVVFLVIARDDSREVNDRRTATATVSVSVLDHNDEPPTVEVCSPAGRCPGGGSVREGPPVAARVAMVIVRDPDTNERVTCRVYDTGASLMLDVAMTTIESSIFELIPEPRRDINANVWTYFLSTKTQLDRERTPRACFKIICRDSANRHSVGTPASHCVEIGDINDSPPRLISPSLSPIRLHAKEEDSIRRPIGRRLGEFIIDDDLGRNAQLSFFIDVDSTEPESAAAFSVDADTGSVTPRLTLDREKRAEYALKVRVVDRGDPPLSALIDVSVIVDDINDHRPEFSPHHAGVSEVKQMRVAENQAPQVLVGRVAAHDADSASSGNGQVFYRLEQSADSRAFNIDPRTGEISTILSLDRERKPHYSLRVLAEDQPRDSPRLTGTCQVAISVDDVNDNKPAFRLAPPEFPAEFRVAQFEPGHLVGQVLAEDPDEGLNQKIVYDLLNNSSAGGRFVVDSSTGNVLVGRSLHDLGHGTKGSDVMEFLLLIRACDSGSPRLCSNPGEYRVIVPAQKSDVAFRGGGGGVSKSNRDGGSTPGGSAALAFNSESVIICLVVTLLVLMIACFAVVCLIVRRRALSSARGTAAPVSSSAGPSAATAGTVVEQPTGGLDVDNAHSKMLEGGYDSPPNYKNFKEEDDYGAYSCTQQLQQLHQFNKMRHTTVSRDYRYYSASPSIGRLVNSEPPQRHHQLQQQYQTLETASSRCHWQQTQSQQQPHRKLPHQQQQQSLTHLYYDIDGRGGGSVSRGASLSHTLPRGGFSVDGKSATSGLQLQQQPASSQQRAAPFCPYTEASFV